MLKSCNLCTKEPLFNNNYDGDYTVTSGSFAKEINIYYFYRVNINLRYEKQDT